VGTTRVYENAQGNDTIYFDNFGCGQRVASDVWQILEQGAIQLTVKVEGSGSVTSSPSGIDCGSDCTETYDAVTGVTLTATPQVGSTFVGWDGACAGSTTTCTLTMNASKSVTATFTNKLITTTTTEIHDDTGHSAVPSPVPPGTVVHDQAVVSGTGAGTPTGTVTFTFFTGGDCTTGTSQPAGTVPLVGGVAHPSDTSGPLGAGSYAFRAHYSGDSNYSESTSACEPLTVELVQG
jgi:Divergent InlB B-repeat domain/Bacterial Ig-like domain (group 3)